MKKPFFLKGYRPKSLFLPLGIGGLFVFLAGRLAFTSPFPMPYDESFHLGLIRVYTQHLNPFLASQPAGADAYGAVARDGSYLYHYLMSFPLRLLQALGLGEHTQILVLRSMNIALGLLTLYLVYHLARRLGVPKLGSQLATLAMAVTPVFYQLSAHINYDNLMLPLTFLTALALITVSRELRVGKVSAARIGSLAVLILLATLVKYTFLPIALVAAVYVAVFALWKVGFSKTLVGLWQSFLNLQRSTQIVLLVAVALSGALWLQRYGVNIVRYHTPHPQCQAVLSVNECSGYGPWLRNYQLHLTAAERPITSKQELMFTAHWLYSMYYQMFSIVHAGHSTVVFTQNRVEKLAIRTTVGLGVVLAIALFSSFKQRRTLWLMLGFIMAGYCLTLWAQNFSDFRNLHLMIAIQGRYMLPILPFLYIFAAAGYCSLILGTSRLGRKVQAAIVVLRQGWAQQFAPRLFSMMSTLHLV